jgi:hypothetical protein
MDWRKSFVNPIFIKLLVYEKPTISLLGRMPFSQQLQIYF